MAGLEDGEIEEGEIEVSAGPEEGEADVEQRKRAHASAGPSHRVQLDPLPYGGHRSTSRRRPEQRSPERDRMRERLRDSSRASLPGPPPRTTAPRQKTRAPPGASRSREVADLGSSLREPTEGLSLESQAMTVCSRPGVQPGSQQELAGRLGVSTAEGQMRAAPGASAPPAAPLAAGAAGGADRQPLPPAAAERPASKRSRWEAAAPAAATNGVHGSNGLGQQPADLLQGQQVHKALRTAVAEGHARNGVNGLATGAAAEQTHDGQNLLVAAAAATAGGPAAQAPLFHPAAAFQPADAAAQPSRPQAPPGLPAMAAPLAAASVVHSQQTAALLPPQPGLAAAGGPVAAADPEALLRSRRLVLVLDIDHTLLNSETFSGVDAASSARLHALMAAAAAQGLPPGQQELFRLEGSMQMWTKLRPGVRPFLQRMAQLFEMTVFTNANAVYAQAMVQLLDPTGAYFGSRIIAQGFAGQGDAHCAATHTKHLATSLAGRECMSLILDDSPTAWPHDLRNLFLIERYTYFPTSRHKFGMAGGSLLELQRDECPHTGMLAAVGDILHRAHGLVMRALEAEAAAAPPGRPLYDAAAMALGVGPPWDVRSVLGAARRRVLQGVTLVFSRVVPLQQDPRHHWLWQQAELFGATCCTAVHPGVSHVVAPCLATEKVHWAQQAAKHVVLPSWLECCIMLWHRVAEARFAVQ